MKRCAKIHINYEPSKFFPQKLQKIHRYFPLKTINSLILDKKIGCTFCCECAAFFIRAFSYIEWVDVRSAFRRLVQIGEITNVDGAGLAFLSLQADSVAVVLSVHLVDGAAWVIAIDILQKGAGNEVERDRILIAINVAPGTFLGEIDDGAVVEDTHIRIVG